MPSVSVVVPTTCELRRWPQLLRAIGSVRHQTGLTTKVTVVVNGTRYDQACYKALCAMPGVDVLYRTEGSAPLAQYAGRLTVDTDFFAFLDDDDEYLPDTLAVRAQPLLDDPTIDFVVSNGYRHVAGTDRLLIRDTAAVVHDPLLALGKENWMASCAGLFRTSSVLAEYFSAPAPYLEWTYLAYKLGGALRMYYVDLPTFRIHDTEQSLSKSDAYRDAELDVLRRILALPLPAPVSQAVQVKLGRAYHDCAERYRQRGALRPAWQHHLKSLRYPGGSSYLLYSRKLLLTFAKADE